jgi:hypothetical protein
MRRLAHLGFCVSLPTGTLLSIVSTVSAQPAGETAKPQPAVGAILKLFDSYRIVMVGETLRDEPLDPRFRDWRRSHQSTFGLMIRQEPGVKPPTRIFTSAPWKR